MATPTVTAIDIGSGPSGTMVVITGSSFDDSVKKVEFGTYNVGDNYIVTSETEIVAYVPEGTGGPLAVKVTNSDGTGTGSNLWTYDTYEGPPGGGGGSAPVVSDVVPDISAYDDGRGGDAIEITGTGFISAKYVYFDEVSVDFTINSDTSISTVSPPQGSTIDYDVEVDVENIYGRSPDPGSANNFRYPTFDVPTITAQISPAAGIAGQLVTITGTSFDTATAVYFGTYGAVFEIDATNPTTTIRAWAPYGPTGTVNVTVTNPAGTSTEPGTATWNDFAYAGTVTGLTATPMANAIELTWNPVSYAGSIPVSYRLYADATPTNPPTTLRATTSQTSIVYPLDYDDGLYYFAVSWVDDHGNESAKCTAVSATALQSVADVIADGAIDAMTMFASGIMPPRVYTGASLPTLPNEEYPIGAMIFWTADGRLYRNQGGGPNTNGGSEQHAWNDRSSSANDGTLTGFPTPTTETSGWDGTGYDGDIYNLYFDGTDDRVVIGDVTAVSDRTFTVEAWVKPEAQTGLVFFTGVYGAGATTPYFGLGVLSSGKAVSSYRDSGGTLYTSSAIAGSMIDGAWHHIAAVLDGTTMYVYQDAVLGDSDTISTGTLSPDVTRIGRAEFSTPSTHYKGGLAAVRCYDSALSATQLATHKRIGPFGAGYYSTGLILDFSAKYATAATTETWVPAVDGSEIGGIINGTSITGNSITAGQIAAAAIGADEIAAQSLVAKHVYIGNFTNLVSNPMSEWSTTGKNTLASDTNPDIDYRGSTATEYHTGSRCRYLVGAGSGTEASYRLTNRIPVRPGEAYYLFCWGKLYSAVTTGATLRMNYYNVAGAASPTASKDVGNINTVTWTEYTMVDTTPTPDTNYWIMPSDAVEIDIQFYTSTLATTNYAYIDEILCHRALDGDLIVDGSITADHISGNYLYGTEIEGGTITGGTITGGTFQTDTSGERVVISSGTEDNRIQFYTGNANEDANGELLIQDGTTYGALFLNGVDFGTGDYPYLTLQSTATVISATIHADSITLSNGSGESITLTEAYNSIVMQTSGADLSVNEVSSYITYSGGLKGTTDWSSNSSDDGVFIQDRYTSNLSGRWKIVFNSNTKGLSVSDGTNTYSVTLS